LGMRGVPLLQINLEETTLAEGRPETAPGGYRGVAREEPEDGLRVLRTVASRRLPTRRREDGIGCVTDVDALAALSLELLGPECPFSRSTWRSPRSPRAVPRRRKACTGSSPGRSPRTACGCCAPWSPDDCPPAAARTASGP